MNRPMNPTTSVNLTRTETIDGLLAEYEGFAALVAGLDADQWTTPSRCEGFAVRDVAGHVIGTAEDVVAGVPGSRTPEEEAATFRDDSPADAAARLTTALVSIRGLAAALDDDEVWNGPSGVPDLTMAEGILTLWYDTYVHADDIRAALGLPSEHGPGLAAAVAYLDAVHAQRGISVDAAVEVAPLAFVLAATGRRDAASVGLDPSVNIYAE